MSSTLLFQVTISDPVRFSPFLFTLWLNGWNASEASSYTKSSLLSRYRISGFPTLSHRQLHRLSLCILRDVQDTYRTLAMCEQGLREGRERDRELVQLGKGMWTKLVEGYYGFEEKVARVLVGKKMNAKERKEMVGVEEKEGVKVVSCWRQFDNMKRIKEYVEEEEFELEFLAQKLVQKFGFSLNLAERYCKFLFLNYYRFEINSGRLSQLSYSIFETIASSLMLWIDKDSKSSFDIFSFLLDVSEFASKSTAHVETVRAIFLDTCPTDIRITHPTSSSFPFSFAVDMNIGDDNLESELESEDRENEFVLIASEKLSKIATKFGQISKFFFNLATGLRKGKEIRTFFSSLNELCIMLFRLDLQNGEIRIFFDALIAAWGKEAQLHNLVADKWLSFLALVKNAVCLMSRKRIKKP